jgi:4-hydroxy-tetrahydrodipicolinate synthase
MKNSINGIVPVMLTPFDDEGALDREGLEHLVDWYLNNGAGALFAVCQSSEMQLLALEERIEIAGHVVRQAGGRVPVIASGHVADTSDAQVEELLAMANTGIDGLVLVTNRLDVGNGGGDAFRHNLLQLLDRLPTDLPLGLYECPAPYRRLLSDDEIKFCRDTGRFAVLKDVSCDLATVNRRLKLVDGSPLAIINANAAIAFDAMRAGSPGFAGVFTNFHPDLYAWLYEHRESDDPLVADLVTFLALAASSESMGYPGLAKLYHQRLGTFGSSHSRAIDYDLRERHWAIDAVLDHIGTGSTAFRKRIHDRSAKRGEAA